MPADYVGRLSKDDLAAARTSYRIRHPLECSTVIGDAVARGSKVLRRERLQCRHPRAAALAGICARTGGKHGRLGLG